jgi:hypothetical protein
LNAVLPPPVIQYTPSPVHCAEPFTSLHLASAVASVLAAPLLLARLRTQSQPWSAPSCGAVL